MISSKALRITLAGLRLSLFDRNVFRAFVHDGEVVEIRVIQGRNVTAGYFDNHEEFCEAVKKYDKAGSNVYFTLQVIDPRLLGRAFNRPKQGISTTSDKDVLSYRWLPVDIDPVRPSDVSSNDSELKEAYDLREEVIGWIGDNLGFKDPIKAMSGNGYHLLYRLADLENSQKNRTYIKDILKTLDEQLSTRRVGIDTSVFNPARIWKLYGTTARKGDPIPGNDHREARPHRVSFIEELGDGNDIG